METRTSGKVRVEVEYDPNGRTHRASPPGVYRARVFLSDEPVDSIIVGCPKAMSFHAMSEASVSSVARTAIYFTIGDRLDVEAEIEKDESGAILVRSDLSRAEPVVSSPKGESALKKRARRNPRLAV